MTDDAFNPVEITVNGKTFSILQKGDTDIVLYQVTEKETGSIFHISLNEDAAWESTSNVDEALAKQIGELIEQNEI